MSSSNDTVVVFDTLCSQIMEVEYCFAKEPGSLVSLDINPGFFLISYVTLNLFKVMTPS